MEKGELGNLRAARIDRAGAVCSGACAVHCATFSLLPSAATSFGVGVVAGAPLEWGLTAVAVALAAMAFATGWRRHRDTEVAAAFALGLAGLVTSRVLEEVGVEGLGPVVGIAAAVALIVGHGLNYRESRRLGFGRPPMQTGAAEQRPSMQKGWGGSHSPLLPHTWMQPVSMRAQLPAGPHSAQTDPLTPVGGHAAGQQPSGVHAVSSPSSQVQEVQLPKPVIGRPSRAARRPDPARPR